MMHAHQFFLKLHAVIVDPPLHSQSVAELCFAQRTVTRNDREQESIRWTKKRVVSLTPPQPGAGCSRNKKKGSSMKKPQSSPTTGGPGERSFTVLQHSGFFASMLQKRI